MRLSRRFERKGNSVGNKTVRSAPDDLISRIGHSLRKSVMKKITDDKLIEAEKRLPNVHMRLLEFRVGAALALDDETIITGC